MRLRNKLKSIMQEGLSGSVVTGVSGGENGNHLKNEGSSLIISEESAAALNGNAGQSVDKGAGPKNPWDTAEKATDILESPFYMPKSGRVRNNN